jgi:hypothetical protein
VLRNRSIVGITMGWTGLLVVALVGFATVGSAAPSLRAEARNCYRVPLLEPPRWISSAAWIEDSSRLLVVDPHRDALISYDFQGRSTPLQLSGTAKVLPATVARTAEGFLLEKVDGHFLGLDSQLRTVRESVPVWKNAKASEHVGSLYQWTVVGDQLVGFGAITRLDQRFELGFLRAPLRLDGKAEMLRPFANEDFYLLSGYSYLASLGDEAYFVLMDKRPAIYRAVPGSGVERLRAFPDEYRIRPDFHTRMTGPKTAPDHYAELKGFAMPAGLYAQDGLLYLLTRRPDGPGKTAWWLYQIDPQRDLILGRVQLPTSSDHLTVVPGERSWFVFERGPVVANSSVLQRISQTISSMVVIQSSAIRSLAVSATCSDVGK